MIKRHLTKLCLALVATAALFTTTAAAARRNNADVLVVPSRYTIVQFAFDIVAMREVALVAYDNNSGSEEPLLHAWDADNGSWKRITADEYAVGAFSSREPEEMILIGSDEILPAAVIAGASQAKNVTRIDTLSLMTVVNTLNKRMKFSSREWSLLAERHGLKIKDLNYERRRWGRYGPPGTKPKKPARAAKKSAEEAIAELDALEAAAEAEETAPAVDTPDELEPVEEKGVPEVDPIEETAPEMPEAKATIEPAPEATADVVEPKVPAAAMEAEEGVIDAPMEAEASPADK